MGGQQPQQASGRASAKANFHERIGVSQTGKVDCHTSSSGNLRCPARSLSEVVAPEFLTHVARQQGANQLWAMMGPEQDEVSFTAGCEPVVGDDQRRRLLWLMTEYFRTVGYTDIKARLPGFMPPPVLSGTIEDHRPDFTCRQTDTSRTPIILEIVTPETVEDPLAENRWSLLSSAAKLYNAELHFVVPKWAPDGPIDPALKRRLARMEVMVNRVWTV